MADTSLSGEREEGHRAGSHRDCGFPRRVSARGPHGGEGQETLGVWMKSSLGRFRPCRRRRAPRLQIARHSRVRLTRGNGRDHFAGSGGRRCVPVKTGSQHGPFAGWPWERSTEQGAARPDSRCQPFADQQNVPELKGKVARRRCSEEAVAPPRDAVAGTVTQALAGRFQRLPEKPAPGG